MDRRYKINQEEVNQMRVLRKRGLSYQKIADIFEVSYSTALYWCDSAQREKQRAKNARRRRKKGSQEYKKRIREDLQKRKDNFDKFPQTKLRHIIQSAINEKRANRKSVKGMSMKEAKKLVNSGKLKLKNAKIQ
tara:strand:- start:18133 stop:18534 length:402 start_codon:yes stop_codon:yes gene_type:complete